MTRYLSTSISRAGPVRVPGPPPPSLDAHPSPGDDRHRCPAREQMDPLRPRTRRSSVAPSVPESRSSGRSWRPAARNNSGASRRSSSRRPSPRTARSRLRRTGQWRGRGWTGGRCRPRASGGGSRRRAGRSVPARRQLARPVRRLVPRVGLPGDRADPLARDPPSRHNHHRRHRATARDTPCPLLNSSKRSGACAPSSPRVDPRRRSRRPRRRVRAGDRRRPSPWCPPISIERERVRR